MARCDINVVVLLAMVMMCVVMVSGSGLSWMTTGDRGHMTNCGDEKNNFTMHWSPANLVLGGKVQMTFEITPAADLTDGTACLTISVANIPNPIIDQCQDFKCKAISQYLPGICPMTKGKPFHYQYNGSIPFQFPVPVGSYKVKAKLSNTKKEPILCAQGTIAIKK